MDSKKSLRYSYSHAVAGQEDCLYLNIYSPVSAGSEGAAALPVMVWIYGGGYSVGYNTARGYGPQKFMDTQQVILVPAGEVWSRYKAALLRSPSTTV